MIITDEMVEVAAMALARARVRPYSRVPFDYEARKTLEVALPMVLDAFLSDQMAVYANLLRKNILTRAQLLHLAGISDYESINSELTDLRRVIMQIASCKSHFDGDIISLAQKTAKKYNVFLSDIITVNHDDMSELAKRESELLAYFEARRHQNVFGVSSEEMSARNLAYHKAQVEFLIVRKKLEDLKKAMVDSEIK